MREQPKDRNRLQHILQAIDTILSHYDYDLQPLREQVARYLDEVDWDASAHLHIRF